MNEEQMRRIMVKTMLLSLDQLTDLELSALYLAVSTGNDNPVGVMGYEKVSYIFEKGMHEEIRIAFLDAAAHRINHPDFGSKK